MKKLDLTSVSGKEETTSEQVPTSTSRLKAPVELELPTSVVEAKSKLKVVSEKKTKPKEKKAEIEEAKIGVEATAEVAMPAFLSKSKPEVKTASNQEALNEQPIVPVKSALVESETPSFLMGGKTASATDEARQSSVKEKTMNQDQVTDKSKPEVKCECPPSGETKGTEKLKKTKKKHKGLLPWWGWLLVVLLALLSAVFTFGYLFYTSTKQLALNFQAQASETVFLAREAYDILKTQNLAGTKAKLDETKTSLTETLTAFTQLESTLNLIGYGKYYQDGLIAFSAADDGLVLANKTIGILEPYAQMLGFTPEENADGGTAEDRVKKILDALEVVGPELDTILTDVEAIQQKINQIDPKNYPETVAGFFGADLVLPRIGRAELLDEQVRSQIQNAQQLLTEGITTFKEYRPLIDQLPEMMGAKGQRKKYLILFQNNNELRPTGGFLTAYSIVFMEDGKVTPEKSDDIYELDKKFTQRIDIPAELGRYLTTERYWNLRDMNIDPDFKQSMDIFLTNYKTVRGEPQDIDGIIAIDTRVLTDLVDTLGPVQVEGYGEFSTQPDAKYEAPQIVVALSEIITRPTPYLREDRKGILGPMMKAILQRTYGAGNETFPALFQLMLADVGGRHVQAYFLDPKLQEAAEKINLAGRMIAPTAGEDFLAIVDANLGGAKSNLFIDYSVEQTVLPPEDGVITKQVVIDYKNSRPGDNCNLEAGLLCLNSVNNDWNRIYLPLGSKLISAKGYKGEPQVYDDEEKGLTVIDGFFSLNPNSNAKVDLQYTVPYTDTQTYKLKIWQQGGLRTVKHLLDVDGNQEEIEVNADTIYNAQFE